MHKNTPKAIQAEPYKNPAVNSLFLSKIKAVKIANKPKINKVTATTRLRPSFKTSCFPVIAKAIIKEPPNNNRIDRISCNQTYLLNKLFMWNSSLDTIIVFAKGN